MICRNVHRFAAVRRGGLAAFSCTTRKFGVSMMLAALWLCASGPLLAQTFTTVFSFNGSNGSIPLGLVQATDGNLYGTTQLADGTIFKITPSGTLTTLFAFNGLGNSPALPAAGLVQGTDGNFYGTTEVRGSTSIICPLGPGCGTVFKITPGGTLTTLHNFDKSDGGNPAQGWSRAPTGTSTERRNTAGLNPASMDRASILAAARSSKSPPVAR